MRSNFHEKQDQKLERYSRLAKKFRKESSTLFAAAKSMASAIPFGQPILVGHHSERRDRKYRERIHGTFGRSFQAESKADHYESKAAAIGSGNAISSDDPDAIAKLEKKLAGLERNQNLMKEANKVIKAKKLNQVEKVDALVKLGLKESQALEILQPDFCGRIGFQAYALSNNNATMKQVRERIEKLKKLDQIGDQEKRFGDIRLVISGTDNRVKIFFPGKPADEVRSRLKSAGFRWAPSEGAWMRQVSNYAIYQAESIISFTNN